MATTYDLTKVAGALAKEFKELQVAARFEQHFNVLAVPGLAVGDTVAFSIQVPRWARTICVEKRSNTSNSDNLIVTTDDGLPIELVLPLKTANAVQTTGSSANNAANVLLMQLYPVGNNIKVSLTIAGSVPAQLMLSVMFYDY